MYLLDSFVNYLSYEKNYSQHTIKSYSNDLIQFYTYISQYYQKDYTTVTTQEIRQWIVSLLENEYLTPSIHRKISALKAFYKYLLRQNLISHNPTRKLVLPKTKKRLPTFIESQSIQILFNNDLFEDTFEGWRDKIILSLLYATGIRLNELINLKINDIDLKAKTIKVFGKRKKERIIPFGDILKSDLEQYLKFRPQINIPYLIITNNNTQAYPMFIYRIVKQYLNLVTTENKKSPHVLRHTFATHLLNNGADLNAIKELLGHSNLAATQVYTHNSFEQLKKVYKKAHPRA